MSRASKILLLCFIAALPLLMAPSGGFPSRPTFQQVFVRGPTSAPQVSVRSTSAGASNVSYVQFADNAGTQQGYVGDNSSGNNDIALQASSASANVNLVPGAGGSAQVNGVTIATQETGSFVAVFDQACTTNLNVTVNWARTGNMITMRFPNTSNTCTSDTIEFISGANIPAAIRPADTIETPVLNGFLNNATNVAACMWINGAGGNIEFQRFDGARCLPGTWTNSGTKGFSNDGFVFTYPLN